MKALVGCCRPEPHVHREASVGSSHVYRPGGLERVNLSRLHPRRGSWDRDGGEHAFPGQGRGGRLWRTGSSWWLSRGPVFSTISSNRGRMPSWGGGVPRGPQGHGCPGPDTRGNSRLGGLDKRPCEVCPS